MAVYNGGAADDRLYGTELADWLYGFDGSDVLYGGGGNDALDGGSGHDVLNGGIGADLMTGGAGDDQYYVDDAGDRAIEASGGGTDRVYSSISFVLPSNVENLTLTGTTAVTAAGNALDNVIIGNSANNVLNGYAGADVMLGGFGNDTYYVDNAGDRASEAANAGTDQVYSSVSFALWDNVERLTLIGSANITATGNAQANTIIGNSGNNVINGAGGADAMNGGAGNDAYYVDDAGDRAYEAAGGGTDAVYSSIGFTLGANLENLSLTGNANVTGTGNALDNVIVGNAGSNLLSGGEGNDTLNGGGGSDQLNGGGGNDTLDGGAGIDVLSGGAGDDSYYVGTGEDAFSAPGADDLVVEGFAEGWDTIYTYVDYALGSEVEVLAAATPGAINDLSLTGNGLQNEIYGNDGANWIDGGLGSDALVGRGGADHFAFTADLGIGNVDVIADFQVGIDKIALDAAVFEGLAIGQLSDSAFVIGTQAQDADDRIIFDPETGALLFDADGAGGAAAVQFATIDLYAEGGLAGGDIDYSGSPDPSWEGLGTLSAADILVF